MAGSPEYWTLRECETELMDRLKLEHLLNVAGKAVEFRLSSYRTKENLESMNITVPRPSMCRYFLFSIYSSIVSETGEININAYERWLHILSRQRVTTGVYSRIQQYRKDLTDSLAMRVMTPGSDSLVLAESDVTVLTESLSGCSSKWKEIATSLGLPDNDIKNVIAMMHMYTPVMCLKEVLLLWILGKHKHAKPPTVEQLERALCSKTVGLGSEAYELRSIG